jgi:hypothetical protein
MARPERLLQEVVPEIARSLGRENIADAELYEATLAQFFRQVVEHLGRTHGLSRQRPLDVPRAPILDGLRIDDARTCCRLLGAWLETLLAHRLARVSDGRWVLQRDRTRRKAGGSYFTPEPIVRRILERTVVPALAEALEEPRADEELPVLRILDPAMGTGQFLVIALEVITDRMARSSPHIEVGRIRRHVAEHCLFGVDVSPLAVELARASVWLAAGDPGLDPASLERNLRCGNALVGECHAIANCTGALSAFHWSQEFPDVWAPSVGFDTVIGNPPFLDKKRIVNTLPELDQYWRTEAAFRTARGIYDTYMLFLERAIQLVKPFGRIGLVTPIPWLTQPAGAPLRELLLENGALRLLDESAGTYFEGALVKVVGVILDRGATSDRVEVEDESGLRSIPRTLLESLFDGQIRIDVDPADWRILEKIRRFSRPLRTYYTPTFGLRACSRAKGGFRKHHLVRDRAACGNPVPYLEADEVAAASITWRGRWLDYQPDLMYSPRTPTLFESPKILVPSLLARSVLRAAYDPHGYYVDQSLVCVSAEYALPELKDPNERPSLEAIALQINSATVSFVFAHAVVGEALGGGAIHATPGIVGRLPIAAVDVSGPIDERLGDVYGLDPDERGRIRAWYHGATNGTR